MSVFKRHWQEIQGSVCIQNFAHCCVSILPDMFLYVIVLILSFYVYRWFRELGRVPDKSDKFVYITGCDSGFGNLLARHLDKKGFRVIAGCYSEKGEDELKKICTDKLTTLHLDVTDNDNVKKVADAIKTLVGQRGLWAVVNNAGVSVPSAPYDWLGIEDFKHMLDVNLYGVIAVTLSVLPLIKKAKGRVVNVASVFGRISPIGGAYCISKYGVEAFNDSLRRLLCLAPFGVNVLCIEPGFFRTTVTDSCLIKTHLEKLWERLPQDIKDEYGSDYLDKVSFNPTVRVDNELHSAMCPPDLTVMMFNQMSAVSVIMREKFEKMSDGDLMKVVNCMEHAVAAVHPRTRYSPGWDAKFFWLPLSYMPTFISDAFFLRNAVKPKVSVL
ncbi:dehydrogenase/reductase SDR family member 9 [Misgurnus anguillicaudatus]|uniref:dehydrogenase/reductase SDR family member 9 n=1 Tax=Misgurnus anguillicaudatus TaxID=75329 RepID=UPI003CCF14CA